MRTVQDLINEAKTNPNHKGKKPPKPLESGPLRENKPLIYNAKTLSNPVLDAETVKKLKL